VILEEAVDVCRESDDEQQMILATAQLAILQDDPERAKAVAVHGALTGTTVTKLLIQYTLWKATGDPTHLADAWQLLNRLSEHAPPEFRERVFTDVPLHRSVCADWESARPHGETASPSNDPL
jgi:hypothetical protein